MAAEQEQLFGRLSTVVFLHVLSMFVCLVCFLVSRRFRVPPTKQLIGFRWRLLQRVIVKGTDSMAGVGGRCSAGSDVHVRASGHRRLKFLPGKFFAGTGDPDVDQ